MSVYRKRWEQYACLLETDRWYTGSELQILWGVPYTTRKQTIQQLVKKGFLTRTGKTTSTQYKLKVFPNYKHTTTKTALKTKTKNNPLDNLIEATTAVGTENELLKQTLRDIRTMIDKALEES